MLEVDRQEVPAFIEIVPFGPAEIQRLQGQGYLKL
jgi:intracellular sulfur oxidation DsrE/DsrF family protein